MSHENEVGGFMAGTHKMHRTNYGPDSPLPAKVKVLLMIQHHLIANWEIRMAIGRSIIERETGLSMKDINRSIKALMKDEFLLVETRKINKVFQESIYRLHPKRFGENPLYQGEFQRPTFQVIPGGKKVGPLNESRDKNDPTPSGQNCTYPSGQNCTYQKPEEPLQSSQNAEYKNLKERDKNFLREDKVDTFTGNGTDNRDPRLLAAIQRFRSMPTG